MLSPFNLVVKVFLKKIQIQITRAADNNCYVVMASLDLSAGFDMANTELLIKRCELWMSMTLGC